MRLIRKVVRPKVTYIFLSKKEILEFHATRTLNMTPVGHPSRGGSHSGLSLQPGCTSGSGGVGRPAESVPGSGEEQDESHRAVAQTQLLLNAGSQETGHLHSLIFSPVYYHTVNTQQSMGR